MPNVAGYFQSTESLHMNRKDRKRTFRHVRSAKIQVSLRIRTVWSESSLDSFW